MTRIHLQVSFVVHRSGDRMVRFNTLLLSQRDKEQPKLTHLVVCLYICLEDSVGPSIGLAIPVAVCTYGVYFSLPTHSLTLVSF